MDRNALIAYIYDLYSVEQAIAQIDQKVQSLENDKKDLEASLRSDMCQIKNEESQEISDLEKRYQRQEKADKRQIEDGGVLVGCFTAFAGISAAALALCAEFATEPLGSALCAVFFIVIPIIIAIITHISTNKNAKTKAEKRKQEYSDSVESIRATNSYALSLKKEKYRENNIRLCYEIAKQNNLKKEFESLRYDLYDKLKLIPAPHQNLFSICYVYKYLITSRESDLNYIFTQLNLEKIIDQLKIIAENQREIILIQRQILSQVSHINAQLQGFRSDFNDAMSAIQSNQTDITDNQRSILNNQATMYRAYLETAKQQAQFQEEAADYVKMIEQNTEVNAMFQRAEFLGLNMDRNYSGNY